MKCNQVVIPPSMRKEMLTKIHKGHQGADSSIRRARETLFWPGMRVAIHFMRCALCAQYQVKRPVEPMEFQEIPILLWEGVSVNLFQLDGRHYLSQLTIHYIGFIEIEWLRNTTAAFVINAIKKNFARAGIPRECVSDNSHEYSRFAGKYGFKAIKSSPFYSKGNVKAESAIKVAKNILKKVRD